MGSNFGPCLTIVVNQLNEGSDSYGAVALPDEYDTVPRCELPVALENSMDLYVPLKLQLSMEDQMMMGENEAAYSECIAKDEDIEKGKSENPIIKEEPVGNLKNEEQQKKQISFEMGGKYLQLLMNHNLILPKFSTQGKTAADKIVEAPRMRKYKRTAPFNSRKVALLFSVLSSLGTMILIYLTLRV